MINKYYIPMLESLVNKYQLNKVEVSMDLIRVEDEHRVKAIINDLNSFHSEYFLSAAGELSNSYKSIIR